jgi:hypothetical protein
MQFYCFECYAEDGGCSHQFELSSSKDEISKLKPRCPNCKKYKPVGRNYGAEHVGMSMDVPRTIGALADKNADAYSDERKQQMILEQNEYKLNRPAMDLPDGMSWVLH